MHEIKLPMASEILIFLHCVDQFFPYLGCIHYIARTHKSPTLCISIAVLQCAQFRSYSAGFSPLLTVPAPEVTVDQAVTTQYAGRSIALTCHTTISEAVDTDIQVLAIWTKSGLDVLADDRFTSAVTETGSRTYESVLSVSSLSLQDSGDYSCEVSIISDSLLITGSTNIASVTIEVTGACAIYYLCCYDVILYLS